MEERLAEYIKPFLNQNKILRKDFENLFNNFDDEMMELVVSFIDKKSIQVVKSYGKINRQANEVFNNNKKKIESTNEELCIMYQRGNYLALDALIQKNQYLVYSRVNRYVNSYKHDLSEEDLFQEGCMGLIKAVERFNNDLGFKLTTYAVSWIDQSILRAITDKGFTVRVPVHMFEKINKLNRVYKDINSDGLSHDEIDNIVIEKMDITREELESMLAIYHNIISLSSLNTPIGESGDTQLGDMLDDLEVSGVFESVAQNMLKTDLENILYTLTEREKQIIDLRFGLKDDKARTLEEVGGVFNVTRERIRQIEAKALKKLRHPARSKRLRSYMYEE